MYVIPLVFAFLPPHAFAGKREERERGTMADSFGYDGSSDDEGTKTSAQFISEPTGKPMKGRGGKGQQSFSLSACWSAVV